MKSAGVKLEWEVIDDYHQRCSVPGGWLVKAYEDVMQELSTQGFVPGWDWRISICFVPDTNHEWGKQ